METYSYSINLFKNTIVKQKISVKNQDLKKFTESDFIKRIKFMISVCKNTLKNNI